MSSTCVVFYAVEWLLGKWPYNPSCIDVQQLTKWSRLRIDEHFLSVSYNKGQKKETAEAQKASKQKSG